MRGLWCVCLSLVVALFATPGVLAASDRDSDRHVFALLIGQPRAPGLARLSAVETDVAMMHAFFGALAPARTFVHLPRGPIGASLIAGDTVVRPPDWPAVLKSVEELGALVDGVTGAVDIYVYYAGHGRRRRIGDFAYTDLYLEPTGGDGPGFDGVLTTRLLQDEILDPLDRGPSVRLHLVVDACQSAYLVEARGIRRTTRVRKMLPVVPADMRKKFASSHPRVGALLATNASQVTYEDNDIGGLFSYAVRSAGIGAADLDEDGRITYREVERVLPWILGRRAVGTRPSVLSPGDDVDTPFIDYRDRPVAAVRFAPPVATRYELHSSWFAPYALVYPGAGHSALARLPRSGEFIAAERRALRGPRQWYRFQAADRPFSELQQPFEGPARSIRGDDLEARPDAVFPEGPAISSALTAVDHVPWVWNPQGFTTVGLSAVGGLFPAGDDLGQVGDASAVGLELTGALGAGQDMFTWRLGWSRLRNVRPNTGRGLTEAEIAEFPYQYRRADVPRLSVGYARVIDENALVELSVGGFGGAGYLFERRSSIRDYDDSPLFDGILFDAGGEVTGRVLLPESAWAVRADARLGAQWTLSEQQVYFDVALGMTLGVEYEFGLD